MHKKKWSIVSLACLLAGGMTTAPARSAQAVLAKEFIQKELVQASQQAEAVPSTTIPRSIASLLRTFNTHLDNNGIHFSALYPLDVRKFCESVSTLSRKLEMDFVRPENDPDRELEKLLITVGEEFSEAALLLSDLSPENYTKSEEIFNRIFVKADSSAPAGVATQLMGALKRQEKLDLVREGWLQANKFIENIQGNEDPVLVDAKNKVQSLQTRQTEFVLSQCLSDLYSGYSVELEHIMDNLEPFGTNPYTVKKRESPWLKPWDERVFLDIC